MTKQKNNKPVTNRQKCIARIVIMAIVFTILYFVGKCQRDYVKRNGVWTVYTLDKVGYAAKGGSTYKFHYFFQGKTYNDASGGGLELLKKEGKRFFMMVVPEEPKKILCFSDRPVPDWFTLEAPPEGWKEFPTDSTLRQLMKADSLKNKMTETDSVPAQN